jgi:YVTN family beta-propeller protein
LGLALCFLAGAVGIGQEEAEDPHRRRSTIYVAARGSSQVVALSRDTAERLATIEVGRSPSGLAARSDGDRIYVACAGSHSVQVIDGATRTVLDTITLAHGAAPAHLLLSPDERTLYVAASGLDAVYVLDASSLQQTAEIPVGRQPSRLAISPDGRRLFALCVKSGRVDILDTAAARVLASAPVGSLPSDIALDPQNGTVYVVRPGAPALHALPEGSAQAKEISIDAPAEALAVDSAARRVLAASPAAGRIAVLSPATGASTKIIRAAEVTRLAIDREGPRLYALSARRGVLLYVDRILGVVEREVPVGREPWDLVVIP